MRGEVKEIQEQSQISPTTPLPIWQNWLAALLRFYAGLNRYQWLWIALCIVGAIIVVAPRILSQPVIYQAAARVHFDTSLYGELYLDRAEGTPGPDFHVAFEDAATRALNHHNLEQSGLRFGSTVRHIEYVLPEPGSILVRGSSATAHEAHTLANEGARELVRHIQAAGGREIMRNLLGWELVAALHGEQAVSPFEHHLRTIIEHSAFPMSRPIEPVAARLSVEELTPQEQSDLARALEARYDLWSFAINTRNTTLDALCGTSYLTTTPLRESALATCAKTSEAARREIEERDRAIARRQAINEALHYMISQHGTIFTPRAAAGAVSYTPAEQPSGPIPRHIGLFLMLTTLGGVVFGTASVALDRTAGIVPQMRDLWRYHELIRDMVVRDLRVRYKSSVLGYLWTQLAPLLMMLTFSFVFTLLMPVGIAQFPVFLIVALLPWNYCSEAVTTGTSSVLQNANLIKKVFFPREILPLVSVISSLINYILSLPMMFLVMAVTQLLLLGELNFAWTFLYLPVIIFIQTLFLLGLVFFISALAVFFRDVVHLVGVLILFWFFLTPVFYSLSTMSMPMLSRLVRWLNPMASIVEFYREVLYGSAVPVGMIPTPGIPAADSLLRVLVTSLVVLALGYWFFRRESKQFGEVL